MFTQSNDPNNKNKPAYKNIFHIVTEQFTPSLLVSKNNEIMKKKEMHMLDQNLHKNPLYSTSVPLPMIEQNIVVINIEVEVSHVTTLTTKTIHKTDTVLHLEIDLAMTKVLPLHNTLDHDVILTNAIHGLSALRTDLRIHLEIDLAMRKVLPLHNTLDHDMILTNAIHGLTALHTDLRIDLLIDTTLALDIDHAPVPETIILQNIQIHTDHFLDQEILDFLDPVHTPILETELI